MNKISKKVFTTLNCVAHFFILAISTITGCISISDFVCLLGIPIGINSSALELKICVIAPVIRMYKSIIKKTKKIHNKIVLLAKSKLSSIEFLISKTLIDSNINNDENVLINNVLKEYEKIKKEIKTLKT